MEIKILLRNNNVPIEFFYEGVPRSKVMASFVDAMRPGSNIVLDFDTDAKEKILVLGSEIVGVWVGKDTQ